jgi:uncharacterized caspase-like protein
MKRFFFLLTLISIIGSSVAQVQSESGFKKVYISKIPKPSAPAQLNVSSISFSDQLGNNNKALDAGETGEMKFTISNKGKGDAYGLTVRLKQEEGVIDGISFDRNVDVEKLLSGESYTCVIKVKANSSIPSSKANFKVEITEANGFDADPFYISFNTFKFKNPQLVVADHTFTNKDGEGKIILGEMVNLRIIVQNKGQGVANNVVVEFINPEHIFPGNESVFTISKLEPNESKIISYDFFANKQYRDENIPIRVKMEEQLKKYGDSKVLLVSLEQSLAKTQFVDVDAVEQSNVKITEVSLVSDVDRDIPRVNSTNENRYALIIGNEDYKTYQHGLNTEENVVFARNDAKVFKDYCVQTLGIPEDNIEYLSDATAAVMEQGIDKMKSLMRNLDGKMELTVYYAGHGLPDEVTREAYLIPVDVSGSSLKSAIKLNDMYTAFSESPAQRVTIFLDACFSGGARDKSLIAGNRGLKIKPKDFYLRGNTVVFAASSGDQSSMPYKEKMHGMFTYFLLKKLKETKGEVSYKELSDYLKSSVSVEALKKKNKEQNPQVQVSEEMNIEWENWLFSVN